MMIWGSSSFLVCSVRHRIGWNGITKGLGTDEKDRERELPAPIFAVSVPRSPFPIPH